MVVKVTGYEIVERERIAWVLKIPRDDGVEVLGVKPGSKEVQDFPDPDTQSVSYDEFIEEIVNNDSDIEKHKDEIIEFLNYALF